MTGPEDPRPDSDWESFRGARDRFFARVRPEAMDEPPESVCPEVVPREWSSGKPDDDGHTPDKGPAGF